MKNEYPKQNSNGMVKIELKDCFRDKSFPVTYRLR